MLEILVLKIQVLKIEVHDIQFAQNVEFVELIVQDISSFLPFVLYYCDTNCFAFLF